MDIPEDARLSVSTINDKYIGLLIAVFNYARRLKVKDTKKKKASEQQDMFTPEDLKKLFHSKDYREGRHNKPYKFWLPILGLFTGCRLEELCQLYCEDVKQKKGVWVVDINEVHSDQSVNTSKRRLVPLHPQILLLAL